jgi:hypothetical protein
MMDSEFLRDLEVFDAAAQALLTRVIAQPTLDGNLINLCLATTIATARERVAELRMRQRQATQQDSPRKFKR